jgi:hypothetical protein
LTTSYDLAPSTPLLSPLSCQQVVSLSQSSCDGARICKRLRNPGIESKESIPPAYVAWRAGTINWVVVPRPTTLHKLAEVIPWNRFLGSLKVYKFGLCREWGKGGVALPIRVSLT